LKSEIKTKGLCATLTVLVKNNGLSM
jgi:hypothetical protein